MHKSKIQILQSVTETKEFNRRIELKMRIKAKVLMPSKNYDCKTKYMCL